MLVKTKFGAAVCTTGMLMCSVAFAGDVLLKSPDGAISVQGELKQTTSTEYHVETSLGLMKVERSRVECFGDDCPKTATMQADLTVRGSDTIGDELMPLLLAGYAEQMGAAFDGNTTVGPDTIAMTMSGDNGYGAEIMTAQVQAAGSSTGLKALIDGTTDIAMSSRPAKQKEVSAIASQGRGNILDLQQEYIIAVDSILAVVSPQNPVDSLTMAQLADVFAGRITNWSQLGGPDLPIVVVTRPETSGTRGVFEKAVLKPANSKMSPNAVVLGSNEEITKMVETTPGAIGYAGFAYKHGTKSVNLVSSCGIKTPATAFSAKTEEYPLQRRLRLFVDNGKLGEHANGLLKFAVSKNADTFVAKAGFIDLSVDSDPSGLDRKHVSDMAAIGDEPAAFEAMDTIINDLNGAERLSTTFRFILGSSEFDNKSLRDLGRMVEFLELPENQGREIIVAGFSDSTGNFFFNQNLARDRALTVQSALTKEAKARGLKDLNIKSMGYGELAPVACNDTDQGRARNRRVELWIR